MNVSEATDSLPALIAARAQEDGARTFLRNADDHTGLTYAETDRAGRDWARAFARHGVTAGDTVLTMLPQSFVSVAVWLGLGWLGALEVPINTAYRGRMLRYVVDDSRATCLVVHADFLDLVRDSLGPDSPLVRIVVVGGEAEDDLVVSVETFLADAPSVQLTAPNSWDIAAVLYTSGTTGPSKGVLVPWAQTRSTGTGIAPDDILTRDDVFFAPFPSYHMSGKAPLFAMALVGGQVVLRSRFSTDTFWHDVRTFGVTSTILMGAMVNFLEGQPPSDDDSTSPLRDVLMLPLPDDIQRFERRFGLRARTTFNMTETACCILSDGYRLANSTSCGRVRPGFQARVVDRHDREVRPGELGELVLRADEPWMLMAGYWRKPEATADAWRNQWLHTGDGFTRDEAGNFYFVDRIKDAIRRRGENVSSAEVEAEVNDHPDVLESAAIAVPSDLSEDEIKVVVVRRPAATLSAPELLTFLEGRMAAFMVPRFVEFVDELPKTPTMKVRKAQLRDIGVNEKTFDRGDARSRRRDPETG